MKLAKKLLAVLLAVVLMAPAVLVSADSSKAESLVGILNASDTFTSLNATATYEDDLLTIEYTSTIPSYSSFTFPYTGTVIEYLPDEATNYDEAVLENSKEMFALQLLFAALQLNGYTDEQVTAYFSSEDSKPTYEINGFEIQEVGEVQTFTSDDGYSTVTGTSLSIKMDVSRANLNGGDDAAFAPTNTTVPDLTDQLRADESFVSYAWEDGTLVFENDIYSDDECLYIDHTDYTEEYHSSTFDCVDDVLTYDATEISDYDEAQAMLEAEMWAAIILQYALKANGYTDDEIAAFLNSDNLDVTFEANGIEVKESGQSKTFEGEYGSLTVTPASFKIDLARACITPAETEPTSEAGNEPIQSPDTGDTDGAVAIALLMISLACVALTLKKSQKAAE